MSTTPEPNPMRYDAAASTSHKIYDLTRKQIRSCLSQHDQIYKCLEKAEALDSEDDIENIIEIAVASSYFTVCAHLSSIATTKAILGDPDTSVEILSIIESLNKFRPHPKAPLHS